MRLPLIEFCNSLVGVSLDHRALAKLARLGEGLDSPVQLAEHRPHFPQPIVILRDGLVSHRHRDLVFLLRLREFLAVQALERQC